MVIFSTGFRLTVTWRQGWVEKPNNLQDDAWVTCMVADGNALIEVYGNARVNKNARISNHAITTLV